MSADFASFMLRARGMADVSAPLLGAVEKVDRRRFVAREDHGRAFSNDMLPLPCGQTTDRIDDAMRLVASAGIEPHHRVLEIGTGSGFLTAVLATLADTVTSVERYRTLIEAARRRCGGIGRHNITFEQADGMRPQAIEGTFDRIVSSVAFADEPKHYLERLSPEGVVVFAQGDAGSRQRILRCTKVGLRFERREIGSGWFAPAEPGVALAL